MRILMLTAGVTLMIAGLVFAFPSSSGIVNVCTTPSDFLIYLEGCNIWLRSNPTYQIFLPLLAVGITLVIWGSMKLRAAPQLQR
jgi:uncharacterized membrane protein HdeD (DUF308 family)